MDSSIVFGGSEEENAELQRLHAEVAKTPDDYEAWEKLIRAVETQEGGLNKHSSPQAISSMRECYNQLLTRFPLFYGFWKKYADLEFSIAGTEAAEMVYERGVASITNSVDLWVGYCGFKLETCHEEEVIREYFERAATSVGLDYHSHIFWDKYLEFEERFDRHTKVFELLGRLIHIPLHQYARYFERYRSLTQNQAVETLAPPEIYASTYKSLQLDPMAAMKSPSELERELRSQLDQYHISIFTKTQAETNKRWAFESEIKRPYFHVTALEDSEISNWRKYIDFEEAEGDYSRIAFLYERCLIATAYYEEFWFRYARWMLAQAGKQEEVRNIYQRACFVFIPIALPAVRLQYATFEERAGRPDVAEAVHEAILMELPHHAETLISLANLKARQSGAEDTITFYKFCLQEDHGSVVYGALVAELARLHWKRLFDPVAAREVLVQHRKQCLDSKPFWKTYLDLAIAQPTSKGDRTEFMRQVENVHSSMRETSRLSAEDKLDLSETFMAFLQECGDQTAAQKYLDLDIEVNGPSTSHRLEATQGTKSYTA